MGRGLSRHRQSDPGKRKRSLSKFATHGCARSQSKYAERMEEDVDTFEEHPDETIENPEVWEKYKKSGRVANIVLQELISMVKANASVMAICKKGDERIVELTFPEYKNVDDEEGNPIQRGVAFPTCINVNSIVCHYQPLRDFEDVLIKSGDVVRIELAVHIDGYITPAAHTLYVEDPAEPQTMQSEIEGGIKKEVLGAAYIAATSALRLMKPGGTNHDVTELFSSIAYSFGLSPCQGVLSHRMKRWEEAGSDIIIGVKLLGKEAHQLQETVKFRPGQVWNLDVVLMNGGDGNNKVRVKASSMQDAFIFKRSEQIENMRLKAARYLLTTLRNQGPRCMLPFSYNAFEKPNQAKAGMQQCVQHSLVDPIPVLYCKSFQTVARFKWTVLITHKEVVKLTGTKCPVNIPLDLTRVTREVQDAYTSSLKVGEEEKQKPEKKAPAAKRRKKDLTAFKNQE